MSKPTVADVIWELNNEADVQDRRGNEQCAYNLRKYAKRLDEAAISDGVQEVIDSYKACPTCAKADCQDPQHTIDTDVKWGPV